jgi:prefoldin subunit 5
MKKKQMEEKKERLNRKLEKIKEEIKRREGNLANLATKAGKIRREITFLESGMIKKQ